MSSSQNDNNSHSSILDIVSPYLLLILTTLFWASNVNLGRYFRGELPPIGLAYWRWTVAALILLPFAYRAMWKARFALKANFWLVCMLAALGISSFNTLMYLSLQTTIVTNASILQSCMPIFIILIGRILIAEQTTQKQWIGILTSIVGIGFILTKGKLQILLNMEFNKGDLLMLLAVIRTRSVMVFRLVSGSR